MLKILVRLYLLIIVAYAGALLLIPDAIVGAFHERFMAFNQDQARGVQTLIVRQFQQAPAEQWPAVEREVADIFRPLQVQLLRWDQAALTAPNASACRQACMLCAWATGVTTERQWRRWTASGW